MPRPGLVVGLGGTGQWALTWLKRDLLLSNNGRPPDNIRLLSLDTTTQLEAGARRVTASGTEEEAAEIGGVMLDKGEFIHVGGDSMPIARRVQQGKLPRRQIQLFFTTEHTVGHQIHVQVGSPKLRLDADRSAPQQRPQSCLEFRQAERLSQIIVSSCVKPSHPVVHAIPRR